MVTYDNEFETKEIKLGIKISYNIYDNLKVISLDLVSSVRI